MAVDEKLLRAIDKRRGGLTRSAFVRQAIGNYLGVSGELLNAPDRTGKGGRPKGSSSHRLGNDDKKITTPKPKLKPVPGTGKPDENTKAG